MSEAEKFRAALEADPKDIQAFVGLCHIAEQDSDFEYLAELYRFRAQIIKDSQEIADLYFKAGEVYIDKIEDLTRGVKALLEGFEFDKTHAGIGDRLDVIYRENDDWEATAEILEQRIQALEKLGDNGTMAVVRSDLHQQLGEIVEKVFGDPEKALKQYRKAIELDRNNLPALYCAREIYYASGKFKNAAKLCELEARVEKDTKRRIALYRELSRLLADHLSEPDQAVLALKRALKLDSESFDTKLELGRMIARTKITPETDKNHRWACDFLVKAAKKAEPHDALEYAANAFVAMPDNEEAESLLRSKVGALGAHEKLAEAYESIIEVTAELEARAPYIRQLSKVYIEELGDPERALGWLRKLESLGLEDDAKAIEQLATGVKTRASQMPPTLAATGQPQTVESGYDGGASALRDEVQVAVDEKVDARSAGAPTSPSVVPPAVDSEPVPPPDGMSPGEYVNLLYEQADKARRTGNDAIAEERMLLVLEHSPQDEQAIVYLERRFRARSDWTSLRDLLLRFDGAPHFPEARQTVKLREAARISEEQLIDLNGAIDAWRIIRAKNPTLRDAGDALLRLLSQAERWEELLEIIQEEADATKSRTKRLEALRRIADINRIRLGNSAGATAAFKKILELNQDDEGALEALDEMYFRDQNYEELVPLLNKRAELARDRESKRNLLFRALLVLRERLERSEDAYNLAKEILAISPDDHEVLEIMEAVDEEGLHWGRLLNTLDLRARASDDAEEKALFLRKKSAIAIEQFQDEDAAVKALRDVLNLIPTDLKAMEQLTEIYSNAGEWEDLVEIYRLRVAAVEADEEKIAAHKETARILENNLNRPDEALISWRAVIEIQEDAESLSALLRYYERNEKWLEFAEVLDRQAPHAENDKQRADILFRRAEVFYDKLDSKDESVEALQRIIDEVDPTHTSTLALLRQVLVEENNYQDAAKMLGQQIEHTEDGEEKKKLLILLGQWSKEELDDLDGASTAFEQAFAIDSTDAELLEELDRVFVEAESWDKLLTLIEQKFDVVTDDESKLDLLVRGASICEEQLEDPDRAWSWYRVAFNKLNQLERTIGIIEEAAYRLELWQPLIDEVYGALTRKTDNPDDQAAWWLKIAAVFEEKLDDVAKALEAVLRAFGLAPENQEMLERVDHLAVQSKNWQRLSTVYGTLAGRTEIKEDKIALLLRYAELLAEQEEQKSQAFDVSLKAFELEPTSEDLLAFVERVGEKAERWDDLVRVYSVCLRFVETNEKKADLMMRAVAVLRDKKEDTTEAMKHIVGVLRIDPFDEAISNRVWDAVQALEEDGVSDSKGTFWNQLIEAYRVLATENRKERLLQAELLAVVARIFADELDDVESAFNTLKEIQQLNPRDEEAISKLEGLAREHDYWKAVTDHYRDILDETFEMEVAVMFHKRLARILAEELDLADEASEHYWQIIQLDVSDLNGYEKLREYYTEKEKWNELVSLLERQLDNSKEDEVRKQINLEIATIWEEQIKNRYEARDWYEQIITIWPDNEAALAGLARLKNTGSVDPSEYDGDDDDINSLISIPPPRPSDDEDDVSETRPELANGSAIDTDDGDESVEEEAPEKTVEEDESEEDDQSEEDDESEEDESDEEDEAGDEEEIAEADREDEEVDDAETADEESDEKEADEGEARDQEDEKEAVEDEEREEDEDLEEDEEDEKGDEDDEEGFAVADDLIEEEISVEPDDDSEEDMGAADLAMDDQALFEDDFDDEESDLNDLDLDLDDDVSNSQEK